jgi:hypothetical protein
MTDARITKQEIMAIESPERTKTWNPISHGEVIRSIEDVVEKNGIGVMSESYSTTNNGRNMFGTMTLDAPLGNNAYTMIGFRNSIMKKFAVGLCCGTDVTVCSNLMFSGEYMEFRKHTSGLDYDQLLNIATIAFEDAFKQSKQLYDWQESLRHVDFQEEDMKAITFDSLKAGVIAPNRFKRFLECYDEELELTKKENGLYEFHGAVTRMNKAHNLFTVAGRTSKLNCMCEDYIELAA